MIIVTTKSKTGRNQFAIPTGMYKRKESDMNRQAEYAKRDNMNLKSKWYESAVFYHLFPLGFCGENLYNPAENSPGAETVLNKIHSWIPHLRSIGITAVLLGPVFHSMTHGYDLQDYRNVDPRLGTNEDLVALVNALHNAGIQVVLDAVFHHSGRDFPAFADLRKHGTASQYRDWFSNVDFNSRSSLGDPFNYGSWNGHMELVKFNLDNPDVINHHLNAVRHWIEVFNIDGLRLDVADCLDMGFQKTLRRFCDHIKSDFWLMGEVVHGDYSDWANDQTLHSTTNYEMYKSIYSSHNDHNFFEVAYALNRQFNPENGIYSQLRLYNFIDNHDVDRIGSQIVERNHLRTVHMLLFTIPGIPSLYYGSEWAIPGRRRENSDSPLRPAIHLSSDSLAVISNQNIANYPLHGNGLPELIARLAEIRNQSPSLLHGDYRQILVDHCLLAFTRTCWISDETTLVIVNSSESAASITLQFKMASKGTMTDDHITLRDQLSNEYFTGFATHSDNCRNDCTNRSNYRGFTQLLNLSIAVPPRSGRIIQQIER